MALVDLKGRPLNVSEHNNIEHTIGEELPAPTIINGSSSSPSLGSSSVPAREDHTHGATGSAVFYAQKTTDQSGIISITFITGLATTGVWTAVANRRYKVTCQIEIIQTVATDVWVLDLIDQSVPVGLKRCTEPNNDVSSHTTTLIYVTNSSISGAKDWRIALTRAIGSGTLTAGAASTYPAFLLIEDIGPL